MPLLLAFLKMLGSAAAKGAVGLGKAAVAGAKVGAKAVGKGAVGAGKLAAKTVTQPLKSLYKEGAKGLVKSALKSTDAGKLFEAFNSIVTPSAEASEITPAQPMQYAPGPEGSVIGGQGEVAPGYEMQSPQSAIPPAYRNMAQAVQQPPQGLPQPAQQRPDVGFIRGMINATTGQPQPAGLQDVSQGRRTAYYAGGLIPNIMMSKLGQPSSAEATQQQSLITQRQNMQAGQPVIDPETGQILYSRPKGSVFQPPALGEKEEIIGKQKEKKATTERIGDLKGTITQFERSYDELTEAFPDIGEKGIGGAGTRLIASMGEKTGYFPETTTFLRELKPKANQMARTIEGGRVTDQDRQIYADSFMNVLAVPSETNIRLISNSLIDAHSKGGNINTIMQILSSSENEILQGIVMEVQKQISGGQQLQGQEDFSQMSDEELRRIAGGG